MKIIVGMSGGVDSSIAALLLKEQGYNVEGLFMKNWEEDDDDDSAACSAANDVLDAERVCDKIDIPLHTVNFATEYWQSVFEHFLSEYQLGRTPNPDILCNREIKFKVFLNHALSLGGDYIATGHYARTETLGNHYLLKKGIDNVKDQSYFLYSLTQKALTKTLFPIGNLTKNEVRAKAKNDDLPNHLKKDSTGLCFIGERNFKKFLNRFIEKNPGEIKTPDGKTIGNHEGLMFYTLGQRQGLGIGGQANTDNEPWYVVGKNSEDNVLMVAQGENHPLLFNSYLYAKDLHWIMEENNQLPLKSFRCTAKIRYRQMDTPCVVEKINDHYSNDNFYNDNLYKVNFEIPQRAITPGQSIVFYENDVCLGGGIIQ